tara:strand:- start:45 stop:875 length:831 start_codon:yes stop_codon:yes gene_type:complete
MSNGVLCFANNNGKINYIKQAVFLAKRIKRHLDVPTSIVTSTPNLINKTDRKFFDKIIEIDDENINTKRYYNGSLHHSNLIFKNNGRCQSYDLSPYDNTLVMDTDYVICNSDLRHAFTSINDFQIYQKGTDLCPWRKFKEFEYLNDTGIKFYWATVFCFKKSENTEMFFSLLKHIEKNWIHYSRVYNLADRNFRNDHLFSIAIHMMNGFSEGSWAKELPGKMFYTLDRDFLKNIDDSKLTFLVQKEHYLGEYILTTTYNSNVHVMNKWSLGEKINE